jgi:hypothetical protein
VGLVAVDFEDDALARPEEVHAVVVDADLVLRPLDPVAVAELEERVFELGFGGPGPWEVGVECFAQAGV